MVKSTNEAIKPKFQSANPPELLEENPDNLLYKLHNGLKLRLYTGGEAVGKRLFLTTGSPEFTSAFLTQFPKTEFADSIGVDDKSIFTKAGINYIPPCLRETATIIERAKKSPPPELIQPGDIKGIIHSHSNWSDGSNTLEEMVNAAKEQGFEYLVISDHSKSAFYANGLTEERIKAQHQLIDELNNKLKGFKIFNMIMIPFIS